MGVVPFIPHNQKLSTVGGSEKQGAEWSELFTTSSNLFCLPQLDRLSRLEHVAQMHFARRDARLGPRLSSLGHTVADCEVP